MQNRPNVISPRFDCVYIISSTHRTRKGRYATFDPGHSFKPLGSPGPTIKQKRMTEQEPNAAAPRNRMRTISTTNVSTQIRSLTRHTTCVAPEANAYEFQPSVNVLSVPLTMRPAGISFRIVPASNLFDWTSRTGWMCRGCGSTQPRG